MREHISHVYRSSDKYDSSVNNVECIDNTSKKSGVFESLAASQLSNRLSPSQVVRLVMKMMKYVKLKIILLHLKKVLMIPHSVKIYLTCVTLLLQKLILILRTVII